MNTSNARKAYLAFLIVVIALFSGLRLVNLEADFPPGLTRSGVLYMDEGWYSNAAVNFRISGEWYVEGDFNPSVNMPIGQLLQTVMFSIRGMSLASARLTVALFSLLLVALVYLLTKRYTDMTTSLLIVSLLSLNFMFFAYSRLAILEIIMMSFIVLSLFIVSSTRVRSNVFAVVISSLVLAIAALTKSTALSVLPILMYLSSLRGEDLKKGILLAGISVAVFAAIFATYTLFVFYAFPDDFSHYREINFSSRSSKGVLAVAKSGIRGFLQSRCVGTIIYPVSMLSSLLLFLRSRDFRKNVLVRLSLLWIFLHLGLLSTISYHPPRYFLPLAIPVVILFAVALKSLPAYLGKRVAFSAQLVIVLCFTILSGSRILEYVSNPSNTFVNMVREVERIISSDRETSQDAMLIGHFANTISLETGIRSINSSLGTRDLEWKMEKYRPDYYITLGNEPHVVNVLERDCSLGKIAEWDVFNNYYGGRKVQLFRLHRKRIAVHG